jgi:hypothetical protein
MGDDPAPFRSVLVLDSMASNAVSNLEIGVVIFATCTDAAVNLFGIPCDFWSFGLFVALALVAVEYIRRPIASAGRDGYLPTP